MECRWRNGFDNCMESPAAEPGEDTVRARAGAGARALASAAARVRLGRAQAGVVETFPADWNSKKVGSTRTPRKTKPTSVLAFGFRLQMNRLLVVHSP